MTSSRRFLAATAALLTLVCAAGCAPGPTPSATPSETPASTSEVTPTPPPVPTSTPTPTPTADSLAFPGSCEELLSIRQLDEATGFENVLSDNLPAIEDLPGPLAREVAANAREALRCKWGPAIPQDGFVDIYAFRLEPAERDRLIAGLREASSTFAEMEIDGNIAFDASDSNEVFRMKIGYAFVEDIWVALHAPLYDDDAQRVLAAVVGNVSD